MALLERQIIFKRKDKSGNTYMEFPVTRVDYVEGAVASVNGKLPDDNQNIQINTLDTKSTNPITAVSNDTVAKWIELGAGEYFFNASYLNGQPTASGFLCNRVTGTNVFQLFKSQPSGNLYYRDGNTTNGWTSSWVELLVEQYTLPTASASTLGGVKIGSNITNTNGKISLTKANVTSALGYTPVNSVATQSADGLFSASDKVKLDGIAEGANKYTLPNATSSVLGGVKVGSNITVSSGTISLTKSNVTSALGYAPLQTETNEFKCRAVDPITNLANDTREHWSTLEAGLYFFTPSGVVNDKPSEYGHLIHYTHGIEIFQLWKCTPNGALYHRGGNANGWSGTWQKLSSSRSAFITIGDVTSFTAPETGLINARCDYWDWTSGTVYVNGNFVALCGTASDHHHGTSYDNVSFFVNKGDYVEFSKTFSSVTLSVM